MWYCHYRVILLNVVLGARQELSARASIDALSNLQAAKDSRDDLERAERAAANALKLAQSRYDVGYSGHLDLLDAQRSAAAAQLDLVRTRQTAVPIGQNGVNRAVDIGEAAFCLAIGQFNNTRLAALRTHIMKSPAQINHAVRLGNRIDGIIRLPESALRCRLRLGHRQTIQQH